MTIIKLKHDAIGDILEAAVRYFETQPRRVAAERLDGEMVCSYYMDGQRCIVGSMFDIDDSTAEELVGDDMLVGSVYSLTQGENDVVLADTTGEPYYGDDDTIDLLVNLQEAHDDEASWGPDGFIGWDRIAWEQDRWGYLPDPRGDSDAWEAVMDS